MSKTVKLTRDQLKEAEETFKFVKNNNSPTHDGNSKIGVNGKLSSGTNGNPVTTDKFASMNCPQDHGDYMGYGYRYGMPTNLREDDKNNDGVDDFYNRKETGILGNGKDNDSLTKIPKEVNNKINALINVCSTLTQKQKATALNKFLEALDISSLNHDIKKFLIKKLLIKK